MLLHGNLIPQSLWEEMGQGLEKQGFSREKGQLLLFAGVAAGYKKEKNTDEWPA